ncbi:acyl-CoA synthetase [Actinomadura verrucosospora]|uniref:Acyl-CoA synthetase n=1 Tax=Actinomadura verrucosospora TaxID=46165 RepID=A0A7D3ZU60_ACTVE|nr:acyl-CoA synthetase [Actinomadura verrucosospora]QKG26602.1 acyl-CoA synthetase [Actinomadura verrucosospora]
MRDLLGETGGPVRIAGRELPREDLLARASAVAAEIAGADAVAVHATASAETVIAVVGGLMAGVPVVPLPPDSGPDERAHILNDSGAALLLAARAADVGDGGPPRVPIDDLPASSSGPAPAPASASGSVSSPTASGSAPAAASRPASTPAASAPTSSAPTSSTSAAETAPDATALILYTSGTTGAPKGVMISRAAIGAALDSLAEAWAWTPDDVLVHGLPLFHVHGLVLGVLGPLRVGSRLVHTGRPKPEAYAAAASEDGGSLFFGVPTVWSRMAAAPAAAEAMRGARLLVSGSAPLPVPAFERLEALTGHRPVERYGMTETLITISARADGERRPGYVGLPLPGIETRLAAENGDPVPHDGETPGELHVRAEHPFKGYLNRPEATAKSFTPDGWFRTGDIATIGPDGWHRIVGRASTDLIKSGGYRIGAGEVENALLAHPAVREAAVAGTPHDDLGEQVTAYVVADGVTDRQLIDFVADRLSVHKRPRVVHLVGSLPRNAMGKVVKTRLHELTP